MRQITGLRPRPPDDLGVLCQYGIEFLDQRLHFAGEMTFQMLSLAAPHGGQSTMQAPQRNQGNQHLDDRRQADPAIDDLAARAQDLAARSIDYCAETSARARRQMQQAAEATSKYVAEQPGKSLVIAAASGALLATVAMWMSRRRDAY